LITDEFFANKGWFWQRKIRETIVAVLVTVWGLWWKFCWSSWWSWWLWCFCWWL